MNRSTEIKVGSLVLAAIALLAVLVLVIGDFSFEDGQIIKVDYVFVGSLQPGAAVRSSGIKVGKVEAIDFMGGEKNPETGEAVQIRLTLWIEERALNNVREKSKFLINTEGVLGEQYVEIIPPAEESPRLSEGAIVRGDDPPRTDLMMQKAFQLVDVMATIMVDNSDKFERMLVNLERLLQTSDQLLAKNKDQIGPLLENMNKLTARMEQAMDKTGDINVVLENTRVLTTDLRQNMGPMTKDMRAALADFKTAGQNTIELTDPKRGQFPALLTNLNKTVDQFETELTHINGSVENFNRTLSGIDAAVVKLERLLVRLEDGPAGMFLGDGEDAEQKIDEAKKKAAEKVSTEKAPAENSKPIEMEKKD